MNNHTTFSILFLFFLVQPVLCYNLHPLISSKKLSNNSVTSLTQDRDGLLWIGTCDGVNTYDGSAINLFNPPNADFLLSGMLIDKIIEGKDKILWIQTYYGINRLDNRKESVNKFSEYNKQIFTSKDESNNLYVLTKENKLHWFNENDHKFEEIEMRNLDFKKTLAMKVSNQKLFLFYKDGTVAKHIINKATRQSNLKRIYTHSNSLKRVIMNIEATYIIDDKNSLYQFDYETEDFDKIANINDLARNKGNISSIIQFHKDFFISFTTNGLYKLTIENTKNRIERIPIDSGIFCLLKDKYQDMFWIGTDGKGVYCYSNSDFSIKSTLLNRNKTKITHPIRSIYWDKNRTLWLGSKGDGLSKIRDYNPHKEIEDCKMLKYSTSNSALADNSVYSITPGSKNILWIGTEQGLNYYSYSSDQLYKIDLVYRNKSIKFIHDIYQRDDILWIASVGMGIIKAKIIWKGNTPKLTVRDEIVINNGEMDSNYFYSICPDDDKSIWLANRGSGVFKIDYKTSKIKAVQFEGNIVNEIYTIKKNDLGYYLIGTSLGIVIYDGDDTYRMGKIPNNVIHSIENSNRNTTWMGTNRGLIYYDPNKRTFRIFNHLDGLDVVEFSDGASYKDKETGLIFFGGINGFVSISESHYIPSDYMPKILFNGLKILGKRQNIYDFLNQEDSENTLTLKYNQNFFSISCRAIDFINGNNYSYSYKIEGINKEWINLDDSHWISFANLAPQKYKLLIKYNNRGINKESPIYRLNITILPPWYLTEVAYIIYLLIFISILSIITYYLIRINRKRHKAIIQKINQRHKEEVYESKLLFFTNIAHEFCTPLTLIYGPCDRILGIQKLDKQVIKYAEIIKQNTERLNTLIQELIDFRKIETGHRNPVIEALDVSKISKNICHSFIDFGEELNIQLNLSTPSNLKWNTDAYFFSTILMNLISNAFKYSYSNSEIRVEISLYNHELIIKVSNRGRGIKQEDMSKLFDRYTILHQFESQEDINNVSRNGLGLAILSSMVTLLSGHIDIKSTLKEWTHFTITLPQIAISSSKEKGFDYFEENKLADRVQKTMRFSPIKIPESRKDPLKQTMMIIDDDPEMLWFMNDLFFEEYNIIAESSANEALMKIQETHPDIILCDVMMPKINGIEFVTSIRSNKQTAYIPFIFVTAKHNVEEQIQGIDAGTDLYITKPFNIKYLKSSVEQLLSRKRKIKDYYSSAASAFNLEDGKLIHNDQKLFIQEIINIIDKNLQNNKLSSKFIADELNISTRTLYRKVKKAGDISIANMIRDSRLQIAENLLLQTTMTIDEIVFKSGFNNRVSFYNAFSEVNKCTPSEFRESKDSLTN